MRPGSKDLEVGESGKSTDWHIDAGSNSCKDHIGWCFEEHIADEEYEQRYGVVVACHPQLIAHASLKDCH